MNYQPKLDTCKPIVGPSNFYDDDKRGNYFAWNDENFAAVKLMWKEGLSATQIGGKIGCSRNAVLGKLHRHKLHVSIKRMSVPKCTVPKERQVPVDRRKQRPKVRLVPLVEPSMPKRVTAFRPLLVLPPAEPPDAERVSILHVTGCKWPMTAMPPHFFCNGEKSDGSSYCAHHRSRSKAPVIAEAKKLLGVE